jgi:hypothetical protein
MLHQLAVVLQILGGSPRAQPPLSLGAARKSEIHRRYQLRPFFIELSPVQVDQLLGNWAQRDIFALVGSFSSIAEIR